MTNDAPRHHGLRRLALFRPLPAPELDAFLSVADERWLEPGDALFRAGDVGDSLAVVVQGELSVALQGVPGHPSAVAALGPGMLVGEGSLLDPGPRSATAVATVPTMLVELGARGFELLLRHRPRTASRLLAAMIDQLARKLHALDRQVAVELGEVAAFAPLSPPAGASQAPAPRDRPLPGGPITPATLRASGIAFRCGDDDLTGLLAACRERRFHRGEALSRQGLEARSCFIVLSGEVAVVRELMAGERVLAVEGPGAVVGQAALTDHTRRSSTLRARTPVVALELARGDFHRLVGECDAAALGLQLHLATAGARQLREADRRLVEVLTRPGRHGGISQSPSSSGVPTLPPVAARGCVVCRCEEPAFVPLGR